MTKTARRKRLRRLFLLITLESCASFCPTQRSFRKSVSPLHFHNEGDAHEQLLWDPTLSTPPPIQQFNINPLIGTVLNKTYLIDREIPIGSDKKCQLYQAYHVLDKVTKANPVIIKLSENTESIRVEYKVYSTIRSRLQNHERDCFVEIYDHIEEAHCIPGKSALVLEKGEDDLRSHVKKNGRYQGAELKYAMEKVIRIVQALHGKGMVWTEIKAENFIVKKDGTIKGIDLESVIYHQNLLQMYTAESVPPEFPIQDIYKLVPRIQPDYSFDIWGLGILLFEMATGKPFYDGGLKDVEFIKEKLWYRDEIEPFVKRKLWQVDPVARQVIFQCLKVDPTARKTTYHLLQSPYFSKGTVAEIPASINGTETQTAKPMATPLSGNGTGNGNSHQDDGRKSCAQDGIVSDQIEALIDTAKQYSRNNPTIESVFSEWAKLQMIGDPSSIARALSPNNQDASTQHFEAVLMAINAVEKVDSQVARDFLYILHQTVL